MKNFIKSGLLISLGFLALFSACMSTGSGNMDNKQGTMLLWKLETEEAVLHFYGSIHLASEDLYPLPEGVYEAYESSDYIVVEMDVTNQLHLGEIQQLTLAKGIFTDGESIEDYLDSETAEKLETIASENGFPPGTLQLFKPWAVDNVIAMFGLQKLGVDPALGIDVHFLQKAQDDGKGILELETPGQQISILSDIPVQEQVVSLESTINEMEELPRIMNNLIDAWEKGDADTFDQLTNREIKKQPLLYKRLIVERNQNWLEKCEQFIQDGGSYFIIGGAAHFVGEDSLISLLKKKGYHLEQQ